MKSKMLVLSIISFFTFAESSEIGCLEKTGCRWLCQLENSFFMPGSRSAEEAQMNASIEIANGGCPEYVSELNCVNKTGCRWFCKLEHTYMASGSNYAEQVRRNAMIEVQSGKCSTKE